MGEKKKKPDELTEDVLEKSFNDALTGLDKALGISTEGVSKEKPTEEELQKARELLKAEEEVKKPTKKDDGEDEEDEDEEEEEGEEEGMKKSIEDMLEEDPEAEASMDVAPFLKSMVQSFDKVLNVMKKDILKEVSSQNVLIKSQALLLKAQAELSKSTKEYVKKIGETPIKTTSVRSLQKSRFESSVEGVEPIEIVGTEILQKSSEWLNAEKIDLVQAGMIESRVNKGTIGKVGDALDKTVNTLLREAK